MTLDLTINYSTNTTDILIACDSAEWNGNIYTVSGIYLDTLATIHGCDSVVTMDLTINNSISTNDTVGSCDSGEWKGNN